MPRTIKNAKIIQRKSRKHVVEPTHNPNLYRVTSCTSGNVYYVGLLPHGGSECSCTWGSYRSHTDLRSGCSHVVAVYDYIAELSEKTVSAWTDAGQAAKQHRPVVAIGDGVLLTARTRA